MKKHNYTLPSYKFDERGRDPILYRVGILIATSKLSLEEISERSGVSVPTLYSWSVNGKTKYPRFCSVASVLIALDQGDLPVQEQLQKELRTPKKLRLVK